MSYETISFSFGVDAPSSSEDELETTPELDHNDPEVTRRVKFLSYLDTVSIQETIRLRASLQHRCKRCGTENHGFVLDESKILLPFPAGPFRGKTNLVGHVYVKKPSPSGITHPDTQIISERTGPRTGSPLFQRYYSYTWYMIRQDIVRSGLFNEEQLRGANNEYSHIFSRHELEVNAMAFRLVRPETCITCRSIPLSGLSPHWGALYGRGHSPANLFSHQTVKTVDDLHALGKTVRTGFRIRSAEALRRRRRRNKSTIYCLHGDCLQDASLAVEVHLLYTPLSERPRARCRDVPTVFRNVAKRARRRSRFETKFRIWRPAKHHRKYWYFLRTRGVVYTSVHHPHGDDSQYYGPVHGQDLRVKLNYPPSIDGVRT